jgi:uncharacterized NAD-dependent epimerase/dehydratase family protein
VRHPTREFEVGTGAKRPGKRLLAVGTDCSVGKMYTTLALEKELRKRGAKADFRATGQTGIFIAGSGVSIDAVVSDFVSGAVEWLSPANDADHWDLVEGQGSLFHASFAGVSMGLLHGAQPDALVLCHEPTRKHMRGLPHYPLPDLKACMDANLAAAKLTNAKVKFIGASINTKGLDEAAAKDYLAKVDTYFSDIKVGMTVNGTGIPTDRTVTVATVDSANHTVTLSDPAVATTAAGQAVPLTFTDPVTRRRHHRSQRMELLAGLQVRERL